jgi:hypothetical protein
MAVRSSGSPIHPEIALCVALRFLAGASYLDLAFAYEISTQTVHVLVWKVLDVLNDTLDNIRFPIDDVEKLQALELGFAQLSHGHIRGCVSAVDGIVIRTRMPARNEVCNGNTLTYQNRKGYPAIVVLAFCDANKRFTYLSAKFPGSTHDATAFALTGLGQALQDGRLPAQFHIAGDEAFVCCELTLTPWPGRELETSKDAFNYLHSRQRQVIECAFGMLIQRFGIFWRPLRVGLAKWSKIVTVCAKLHNLLVSSRIPDVEPRDAEDGLLAGLTLDAQRRRIAFTSGPSTDDGEPAIGFEWLNSHQNGIGIDEGDPDGRGRHRQRERSMKRAAATDRLAQEGVCRPRVSSLIR